MTFPDLLTELKNIPPQELRAAEEDYFEAVFSQSSMRTVSVGLMAYFGVPLKVAGVCAGAEAKKISQPYGGVMVNQTLYFHKFSDGSDCALLWPWGSGLAVTLKIIRGST